MATERPKKKPQKECEHHNPPKACMRCRRLTELREPGALTAAVIRCLGDWLGHADLSGHGDYCDCPRCESRLLIRLLEPRRHSPTYACGADDCLTCAEARARQDKAFIPCDVAGCPNLARWYYPKPTLFGWNLCDTCKDTDPRGVDCLPIGGPVEEVEELKRAQKALQRIRDDWNPNRTSKRGICDPYDIAAGALEPLKDRKP